MQSGIATLVRLGIGVLGVAGLAALWELLALQAPGTPLYIGVWPGPVSFLRAQCFDVGLLLTAAGGGLSALGGPEPGVGVTRTLGLGLGLWLCASLYATVTGSYGLQLSDLRDDALLLFVARHGGLGLVMGSLGCIGLSRLRTRSA